MCKDINILAYYISAYYKALNTQELSKDQKKRRLITKWRESINGLIV